MLDKIQLQLDREEAKEREDGELGGEGQYYYSREAIISNILFFLDFWHEWVLNFILAEKENQKVLFNCSKMSLFCANQPSVDLALNL